MAETRERYLHCLADVASEALRADDLSTAIPRLLARLGEAAQVCRVYLFENSRDVAGRLLTSQRYEWCQAGVPSQADDPNLRDADYEAWGFTRWTQLLSQGEIIAGDVNSFPPIESAALEAQGIVSLLVLPIFVHDVWYGFIGFDICDVPRQWRSIEVELLQAAADTIAQLIERRQAEKQLRLTQYSIENASDGVLWLGSDSRILYANQRAGAMLGHTGHELSSLYFTDLAPTLAAEEWLSLWHTLRHEGQWNAQTLLQDSNGRIFNVEIRATFMAFEGQPYVLAFVHDITRRLRSEEELRASEERLRRITEQSPVAVWTYDRDLRVTFHSRPLARKLRERVGPCGMVGYSAQDVFKFLSEEDENPPEVALIQRALAGETAHSLWHSDDQYLEEVYAPLRDGADTIVGVIATSFDVTDQHHLQMEIAQAQRMEALGSLAGGIAHDFRNLLTGIIGNLTFMEGDVTPELQTVVSEALQAAHRAAGLTRQLLTFASQSQAIMQPCAINAIVREAVSLLRITLDERAGITELLQPDLPLVNADSEQFHRVIMNLLTNAHDAIQERMASLPSPSSEGADATRLFSIGVTTRVVEIDHLAAEAHHGRQAGVFVLLQVRDDGAGMDAETQRRLFEPFFTTKRSGKGAGMGMPIIHGIVNQHGGWIEVDSAIGKGSTVSVYLPALAGKPSRQSVPSNRAPALASQSVAAGSSLRGGNETILLADDEDLVVRLDRRVLERFGYTVLVARTGQEAIDLYSQRQGEIDLVILDVSMPARSAIEIVQEILTRNPRACILLSSGYVGDGRAGELLARGASAYLSKPYRMNDLVAAVRNLLDRRPAF